MKNIIKSRHLQDSSIGCLKKIFGLAEALASQKAVKAKESGDDAGVAAAMNALKFKLLGIPDISLSGADIQSTLQARKRELCDKLLALHAEQARQPADRNDMTADEKKTVEKKGTYVFLC